MPPERKEPLVVAPDRVPPVRGLVPIHNAKGVRLSDTDVNRWLRLNRVVHKTDKVDLLAHGDAAALSEEVRNYGAALDMVLSLRTDCTAAPPDLPAPGPNGLFDVFLCPSHLDAPHFDAWLAACDAADLPIRVQFQAPYPPALDAEVLADRLAHHGVVAVNVAVRDAFTPPPPASAAHEPAATVRGMNALVRAIEARGIEAILVGLPFCLADRENWPNVANDRQFFLDHQQYAEGPVQLARLLYRRGRHVISKALLLLLARHTTIPNPIDEQLIRLLVHRRPFFFARAVGLHRLTRHWRIGGHVPAPVAGRAGDVGDSKPRDLEPCAACALRRICDQAPAPVRHALPGVALQAQDPGGALIVSPQHFAQRQPKYYDEVDRDRLAPEEGRDALVAEALNTVQNRPCTREIDAHDWGVENAHYEAMPGGLRWYGLTNAEKLSFYMGAVELPFTISITIGGGIADYIGFAFGRHGRVLCPMETYTHRLILHAAADGRYVLLRDGRPVRPAEFHGACYVPRRLSQVTWPRVAIWNIDRDIVTQSLQIWESAPEPSSRAAVRYSALIVSTRYARRLQAVLQGLVRQRGVPLEAIEVIVAYVPGIDATDDVLESFALAHPALRIVRSPFNVDRARAKGHMINESAKLAAGEWVVLLDSDILLHADSLAALGALPPEVHFAAPDGRKMLTPEATARVLLGEFDPWQEWDAVLAGPGEFRLRETQVPIGYFQAVRRCCFERVQYEEYEHFEGADHRFALDMRDQYGKERRLSGIPVLHLDHGGSQWYGANRHR